MINNLPETELFASGHRACAGCGAALAMRHILKAAGPNTIVVHATGCMEVATTPYPQTAWRVPWIHAAFENAAAVASGIESALKKLNKKINILAIGGDGSTFDIGFQALSGAIERGHNFCYVCYDNGAYMNTGIQRSGATPKYASTTTSPAGKVIPGKQQYKKPLPLIIAAHGAYVATANISYVQDLIAKVQKGLAVKGPAYVQIFAPCQAGWRHPPNATIDIAKLAFQTNFSPLFEIENGYVTINKKPSQVKLVDEFLKTQGRFKHLTKEAIADIQHAVDDVYDMLLKLEESKVRI
jgi:pyruvate ferredoxin oxidoreductase beta subunit